MVLKKGKRKRKHSSNASKEENASDNDKYLAYVKIPNKKKNNYKDKQDSAVSSSQNLSKKVKKKKLKSEIENGKTDSKVREIILFPDSKVSISAKPQLNEAAIQLNELSKSNKKGNKLLKKSKQTNKNSNDKSKSSMSENSINHVIYLEDDMQLIMPKTMVLPSYLDDNPSTSSSLQDNSVSCLSVPTYEELCKEFLPMIVEANLKKSTDAYIPDVLKDDEDIGNESDVSEDCHKKHISKSEASTKKIAKAKTSKKKNENIEKSENSLKEMSSHYKVSVNDFSKAKPNKKKEKKVQSANKKKDKKSVSKEEENSESVLVSDDLNCNIPKALQEFYNEVTRGFESLVQKSSGSSENKKNISALSVDKSVKDPDNLIDIVSKNTEVLENSSLINQENVAQFFSLENKVILILRPGTQFTFLGKLKIKVLYGAVELYGSVFYPQNTIKSFEVYSPRGYSSISISTIEFDNTYDKETLWDFLTTEGVDRSLKTKLHDTIQECKHGWSVLLLENFENALTSFLSNHCSFKLFPRIENIKYSWCDPRRAEYILQTNFQFFNSGNEISISPQWNDSIIKQLQNQWNSQKTLCTIITGGKGVGKSTTARYLINNLLRFSKKVVLLDLDPGQAEMTPAACVSLNIVNEPLLGPNFTHLKTPYYQLYLEDVNVTNCITRYIECIKKLVECLKNKKELTQYPVVVNTMGFCKGIGLDICIFLLKLIEPTNVVQILSKRPRNNFDFALLKQTINDRQTSSISGDEDNDIFKKVCNYELHYVHSVAEGKRQFETWNMEPRQQRELVLLSYLSQIIKNAEDKCFCSFTSNSINNIVPYSLPFSSFYVSLIKSSISPTHILAAMNGNIVALCGIDLDDDTSTADKESLTYPMVVIKPPPSTCYGYGIVRGIDMKRRRLYISTPLIEPVLRSVNLLAGCSAVPFSLLRPNERNSGQPYAGDRGEIPTSREARRGYFRVDQTKTNV